MLHEKLKRCFSTRRFDKQGRVKSVSGIVSGKVIPSQDLIDVLHRLIKSGDRVCVSH